MPVSDLELPQAADVVVLPPSAAVAVRRGRALTALRPPFLVRDHLPVVLALLARLVTVLASLTAGRQRRRVAVARPGVPVLARTRQVRVMARDGRLHDGRSRDGRRRPARAGARSVVRGGPVRRRGLRPLAG